MYWAFAAVEELIPVIVFFAVQLWYSFAVAVASMVVTTIGLVLFAWWWGKGVPRFAVVSTGFLLVFAVPTIVTEEPLYFMLSDTILDGFFALLLLGSWLLKRPLLKPFFERIFAITDEAWRILTLRWGLLFLVLAATNETIRQLYSTEVWSTYKLVSTIGILLFGCYQFRLSSRLRIKGEANRLGLRMRN
jgi:intracellular septation protein